MVPGHVEFEKPLPCNLEAERAVLGVVLLDDKRIHTVAEILSKEDFYLDSHRKIFEKMLGLAADCTPIDPITLKDDLQGSDELEKVGGAAYLASLTDGLPRATNVEHYARIVKEKAAFRRIIQFSNEATRRSFEGECSPQEILAELQEGISRVASSRLRSGFRSVSESLPGTLQEIEDSTNPGSAVVGLDSGFIEINRLTGGLHPGDFIIVAARPGLGKTSLCLNIAQHVGIRRQKHVGIFSLEMTERELHLRILCAEADVDSYRVRAGYVSRQDREKLNRAASSIAEAQIFIDDTGSISIAEIRAKAQRLAMERGVDLLIVDYLQLISGGGRRYENRVQEVTEITRALKILAKDLQIPVIAASQLNRAVEIRRGNRKPQLSDLRESGSIEQDADLVLFIHREEVYQPTEENAGLAEIIIAKQRNGPTGSIFLAWLKQFTKFAEWEGGWHSDA